MTDTDFAIELQAMVRERKELVERLLFFDGNLCFRKTNLSQWNRDGHLNELYRAISGNSLES